MSDDYAGPGVPTFGPRYASVNAKLYNALDRMDYWSRELVLHMQRDTGDYLPDHLELVCNRVKRVVIVAQFQKAQEDAREAKV